MLRPILTIAPLALLLAACDTTYVTGSNVPGMITGSYADLPGTPDYRMARQACGLATAGAGGLTRVEFERDAPGGALIMLHARRDPNTSDSRRWRCYFDYGTRAVRAYPA
jgi:hypothetical protein